MPDAPWPLIEVAVAPLSSADGEELLERLVANRPAGCTVRAPTDLRSNHIVVGGMTESDLEAAIAHFRRVGLVFDVDAPQIAYRETITKRIAVDYTHKKEPGGSRQFANVRMSFEPGARGAGNVFENWIAGSIPDDCVTGVEKGFDSATHHSVIHDFPVTDVKATLLDGAWHHTDSSPQAFEVAAHAATREALAQGATVLLEPIMAVAVVTPEEFVGSVIGDLRSRRGQIRDQSTRLDDIVIHATAPLANLFGYVNQLRAFSQGRATFTMTFADYRPLPSGDDGPFPMPAARRA